MKDFSDFGKIKLIDIILDAIEDGLLDDMEVQEMHKECFNTSDFITGTYESGQFLDKHYGVFNAISKVTSYEVDNFGESNTDISSPEKLLNMLVYVLGEELISELKSLEGKYDQFDDGILFDLRKELLGMKADLTDSLPLSAKEVLSTSLKRVMITWVQVRSNI